MRQGPNKAIFRGQVGYLVEEGHREFMANVQGRWSALVSEVKAVLRAAWIYAAAEQFVGRIVDVLRECVVRPEIKPASETMHEIHRSGVVGAGSDRRESGYASEEAVARKR